MSQTANHLRAILEGRYLALGDRLALQKKGLIVVRGSGQKTRKFLTASAWILLDEEKEKETS